MCTVRPRALTLTQGGEVAYDAGGDMGAEDGQARRRKPEQQPWVHPPPDPTNRQPWPWSKWHSSFRP